MLYLGHVISSSGISPNPEKVRVVQEFKVPVSVKAVREFLDTIGDLFQKLPDHYTTWLDKMFRLYGRLSANSQLRGLKGNWSGKKIFFVSCHLAIGLDD